MNFFLLLSHTFHHITHTLYQILLLIFLLCSSVFIHAQRLEIHAIKDFSTNSIATKAWGVGGALDFDQFVKNTTFRINFDWTMFNSKSDLISPKYSKTSGGVAAFYSFRLTEKISFQCGLAINYSKLKYSYIYDYELIITEKDTTTGKPKTLLNIGDFIGIGPHLSFYYEVGKRVNFLFNFLPAYLFSVNSKSSVKSINPEYSKGIWLFPIQLGFSVKLFNLD